MTPIPPAWWLAGSGTVPVAQSLPPFGFAVVALVVAIAGALALRGAWSAARHRR